MGYGFFISVFSSGSIPDSDDGWMQQVGWTGPDPVLYLSLDTLVLMEGTEQREYDALTEGKVCCVLLIGIPEMLKGKTQKKNTDHLR